MYTQIDNIENLLELVRKDKESEGSGAFTANRYPVRFVLFDNFRDCYQFVSKMSDTPAKIIRISQWMDKAWPDVLIGFSKLAQTMEDMMEQIPTDDVVVAPFSELARFYDNKKRVEFSSLISTIKAIENDKAGFDAHRRVYIPLVGLEGKMANFYNDSQSIMWYMKSNDRQQNYRLVLTNGDTFGVKGIEDRYTKTDSVLEWLNVWTEQNLTRTIVCSSPSIFANAGNADPDNAFDFAICNNAHDFLTNGLGVNLDFLKYREEEDECWRKLAEEIDIDDFHFEKFFNSKFDIHELSSYSVFLKTWFEFRNRYERWLLSAFYQHKFCNNGYICRSLAESQGYTDVNLVEALATTIFDLNDRESFIEERAEALRTAASKGIVISNECEKLLKDKLSAIASAPIMGYQYAMKFMTPLTIAEKELMIEWLGAGKICVNDLESVYPDLYHYMGGLTCNLEQEWIRTYFDEYRHAKIANKYTAQVEALINCHNESEVTFNKWYQAFSTTRTHLEDREDIEVVYWIDGLGVDWIPYITNIVKEYENERFFLNEVTVSKAILPTTTRVNKESLLKVAKDSLPKVGDIDELAHKIRLFPSYIINDLNVVRKAIRKILSENPGRKIAIVSDHGISYLSQLCQGMNLPDVTSDHGGRLALKKNGVPTSDSKYIVMDDRKTMCALKHDSLCAKIPNGCGCHGGCVPEEALVPIFIISNQETVVHWTATLESQEVSMASPIIRFKIKGIKKGDNPIVIYNGQRFGMKNIGGFNYETPTLPLDAEKEEVTVRINSTSKTFKIKIKTGAEEQDLFADLF